MSDHDNQGQSSPPTGNEERPLAGDVLDFDIAAEKQAVLEAARLSGARHAAKTLIKDGPLRLVIVGFVPGGALEEHRTHGPVSIQALEGEVEVEAAGSKRTLSNGGLVALGAEVPHAVTAVTEAVVLVNVAWPAA